MVTSTGSYIPPIHPKVLYGGMTLIRSNFINYSSLALARAATTATRYCTVRRQFTDDGSKEEKQVIHFASVQSRVFPAIATAYALAFTGYFVMQEMKKVNSLLVHGKTSDTRVALRLAELHATTSGLKVISTTLGSKGLEDCRMACGGHGYSAFSGLPEVYVSFVHLCTAEGENWILVQQTAQWLLKLFNEAKAKLASTSLGTSKITKEMLM